MTCGNGNDEYLDISGVNRQSAIDESSKEPAQHMHRKSLVRKSAVSRACKARETKPIIDLRVGMCGATIPIISPVQNENSRPHPQLGAGHTPRHARSTYTLARRGKIPAPGKPARFFHVESETIAHDDLELSVWSSVKQHDTQGETALDVLTHQEPMFGALYNRGRNDRAAVVLTDPDLGEIHHV